MYAVLFTHRISSFLCRFNSIISNFRFMIMLIYMGINTKRTPCISCNKEIFKPSFPLKLICNPDFKITPFYFRFLFHIKIFVVPMGLEPITPGLKDRCAHPVAPRDRSIILSGLVICEADYRFCLCLYCIIISILFAGQAGFEPTRDFSVGFGDQCHQPLGDCPVYYKVSKSTSL